MPSIHAIIPAAGRSRRMGRPKQLLDVDGRPMLITMVEPIAACPAITAIIVVTNSLVASSLEFTGTHINIQLNDEPDAEMIDSVRLGVIQLQQAQDLAPDDGILICPGDQPGLTTQDIDRCCQAFIQAPSKIIIATHAGKRGHPMIFPASMVPFVMSNACDTGLRTLPETHDDQIVSVESHSPAVLRNINTPDDFNRLKAPG